MVVEDEGEAVGRVADCFEGYCAVVCAGLERGCCVCMAGFWLGDCDGVVEEWDHGEDEEGYGLHGLYGWLGRWDFCAGGADQI